jgi:hypothetical protein
MKTRVFSTLLLLSVLFAVSLGNTFANGSPTITVKVPFDFVVGKKTLPAGEYTIRENSAAGPGANLLIKGSKNKVAVITGTQPFEVSDRKSKGKLEFTHADGKYFLSRVVIPESQYGRQIRIRSLAEESTKAVAEIVTIQN